jgi:hypothetical protein
VRKRLTLRLAKPLVKIFDWNIQRAGQCVQLAGRDPVDAAFIFVGLLGCNAEQFTKILLSETKNDTPLVDTIGNVLVNRRGLSLWFTHLLAQRENAYSSIANMRMVWLQTHIGGSRRAAPLA